MNKKKMPIGFLDSGVGGLSVLREAVKLMPNEHYIYFGDSKNAPYGVKKLEEVKALTYKVVEFLIEEKGVKAVVIACNTATSAAVRSLRVSYPNVPIIGIEPAVKPAVELGRKGPVIIMATPMTLREKKLKVLMDKYKEDAEMVSMPCPELVELVESGKVDGAEVETYLRNQFKDYLGKDIAAVVLGCTHYPFVRDVLDKILEGKVPIIDGGLGTSKELRRQLEKLDLINDSNEKGEVEIFNSSEDKKQIELSKMLLNR